MKPMAALIAYTCEDEYRHNEYYLECRKIDNRSLMGAGKPVSQKFIRTLADGFYGEASSTPHGMLPARMLYSDTRKGNEKYVWYSPPEKKVMYFKTGLNIKNGEYCIPVLIWLVKNDALCLFAYMSKRVTPVTRLYAAPFFNVSPTDGHVCLGNAKLNVPENPSYQNLITYWEDLFFLSEFSHILGSNPTVNNLVLVIKKSINEFDYDELVPIKKLKLKDIIR